MAEIVLGIGCAHTPQLHTPAEKWEIRAERDKTNGVPLWYKGKRMQYDEVLAAREHMGFAEQTGMETRQRRLEKSYEAIDKLHAIFAETNPNVAVIFGNDQGEMFLDDIKPAFTIMACEEYENMPRTQEQAERLPPGIQLADPGHLPEAGVTRFPGHPELALQLIRQAMADNFDVAVSKRQHHADPARTQVGGLSHAYGFIFKQIYRDLAVPTVLVDNNTFFPPNQPSVQRCFDFGRSIGNAIRDWQVDARVAVIMSGGLSHFVVDEEFDRELMQAMLDKDFDRILSYGEGYFQAGSSEIKSWIAGNAAMAESSLEGQIVDYYPLYRTPAGTGSTAAFMFWK